MLLAREAPGDHKKWNYLETKEVAGGHRSWAQACPQTGVAKVGAAELFGGCGLSSAGDTMPELDCPGMGLGLFGNSGICRGRMDGGRQNMAADERG